MRTMTTGSVRRKTTAGVRLIEFVIEERRYECHPPADHLFYHANLSYTDRSFFPVEPD